jgi:putative ABC transport system substrate-binding protein
VLGGTAVVAGAVEARAQEADRIRHIGVLIGGTENPEAAERLEAFFKSLNQHGWTEGRNIRTTVRWYGNGAATVRELVQLKPDVILAGPTNALLPLLRETRSIPIVFVQVSDPLGQGIVQSLARPTGNVTGFSNLEFSLIGKWLQILKEASPGLTGAGLMISTSNAVSPRWYRMFNSVAPTFAIEPIAMPVKDISGVERGIKSLAARPNSALIVAGDTFVEVPSTRKLIVDLAAKQKLPVLYGVLSFVADGGFLSYGIDQLEQYRNAADYVHRVLRGEKIADLPVQQPKRFRFVINMKVAKALGLNLSTTLVAAADEVIE